MRNVFLKSHVFRMLVTSAIEVYNRETNGVLIGRPSVRKIDGDREPLMIITDAYPLQTERRKPSEVFHGNEAAFKRAISSLKTLKVDIVGGYHSHTWPYGVKGPSEGDVEHIGTEMGYIHSKRWLELIISIKRREYSGLAPMGWNVQDLSKKVRAILRTEPDIGYDITLSAHWIDFSHKKPKVEEAAVFVPWLLD
jgi:proteasome lid subunit RPN8/RPN11